MRNRKQPILRSYWVDRGITREQAAKRLGVAEVTYRSYENGNRQVTGEMALQIEERLGIDRTITRPDLFRRRDARAA